MVTDYCSLSEAILGPQDNSDGKGPLEVCSPASCPRQGQSQGHNRVLRGLLHLVLKTSKDGDAQHLWAACTTASLSSWANGFPYN